MRAAVGDRIVIASNTLDRPVRVGEVVGLRHQDGSPPYLVRWTDTDRTALVLPGPDARVEHPGGPEPAPAPTRHVRTWTVEVQLFETEDDTTAHAVLRSGMAPPLRGDGHAERHPGEPAVPEIGDEVAVGRALHRLGDLLLGSASGDLAQLHGHPSALRR